MMRATIKPLGNKYYGTEVEIIDSENNQVDLIQVWTMGDYEPSERELQLKEINR